MNVLGLKVPIAVVISLLVAQTGAAVTIGSYLVSIERRLTVIETRLSVPAPALASAK